MRIVMTGGTGLLGGNLLYELIKQNLGGGGDPLELILLGRETPDNRLRDRVRRAVMSDGADYVFGHGPTDGDRLGTFFDRHVKCLAADFDADGLGVDDHSLAVLAERPIDVLFHVGAMVDFRSTPTVVETLENTNVRGTARLLRLAAGLTVGELAYVSSAYCCGRRGGRLLPDAVGFEQGFRNPYERSKLKAEVLVRQFCRDRGVRCRVFRPSTICGRLIEPPGGATSKFDVFYEWIAFFLRLKLRMLPAGADRYATESTLGRFRMCYKPTSGLNIVPADYAAKLMYQVWAQGSAGDSFHLVNDAETPHALYIDQLLATIRLSGIVQVPEVPTDPTKNEALYYRHVGLIYTPYVTSEPMVFDTATVEPARMAAGLACPPVDAAALATLIDFARPRDFGLMLDAAQPA